jgi:uncharacterized protein (DUF433 family)
MSADVLLDRITVDPRLMGGKPAIRGRRLAVEHLMDMMLAGDTISDIVTAYPWLELADLHACLAYTGRSVANERLYPFTLQGQPNEAAHRRDDLGPGQ